MNSVCFPMKSMSGGVQYLVIVQLHQHNQRTGIPAKLIQEAMRTWVQPKPDKDRIETTAHQRTCCRLQNPYQCKASPAPVPSACCSENVPAQELPRRSMDKYADCPGLDIWLSARACRLRQPLAPSRLVLGHSVAPNVMHPTIILDMVCHVLPASQSLHASRWHLRQPHRRQRSV